MTLISLIYESNCEFTVKRNRLSRLLEKINEAKNKHDGSSLEEIMKTIDVDCAKSFFKLPQNQKMIVGEYEGHVLNTGVALKCSEDENIFDLVTEKYFPNGMSNKLTCYKWHLKQNEPESKLIKNFSPSDDDVIKCKENLSLKNIQQFRTMIEHYVGSLEEFTCGAVMDALDFINFFEKGGIILYDNITDDLRKSELEKLKEYFKDKVFKTVDCIMKRFEDDPKGSVRTTRKI